MGMCQAAPAGPVSSNPGSQLACRIVVYQKGGDSQSVYQTLGFVNSPNKTQDIWARPTGAATQELEAVCERLD